MKAYLRKTLTSCFVLSCAGWLPSIQANETLFADGFNAIAPEVDTEITAPKGWIITPYASSKDNLATVLLKAGLGRDETPALRVTSQFNGGDYYGVFISSPAISTRGGSAGIPSRIAFEAFSPTDKELEVLVSAQDASYKELGRNSKSVRLRGGEWTRVEVLIEGGSITGEFSTSAPNLVLMLHAGNHQGYAANSLLDLTVDNVQLFTAAE